PNYYIQTLNSPTMLQTYKLWFLKAVSLCFKAFLKPDEAMIYCNLNRTQFLSKCRLFGIRKNNSGYYKRDELDKMLSGEYLSISQRWDELLKPGREGNSRKKK